MFDYVGPEMPLGKKLVFANLWLFEPLVVRQLSASPGTNAGAAHDYSGHNDRRRG